MPDKNFDQSAIRDYIDMVCTSRFLKKYEKIWTDQLLLINDPTQREVGYFGIEVIKNIYATIDTALENAQTQVEFDKLMKNNFGDTTKE